MSAVRLSVASILLALGLVRGAPAQAVRTSANCNASTPVTLLGVDTRSGEAVFALPGGVWVDLRLTDPPTATWFPVSDQRVTAVSNGPGPLFVVQPCGESCLQPARRAGDAFVSYGEALVAPASATAVAAYDAGGTPWIVLHEPGGPGVLEARAFRLTAGEWRASGRLRVTDVGSPGAYTVPSESDAIASGTGLFRAGAAPGYWLESLPDLPAGRRGQVVPLGGALAVDVAADGVVYRTSDRGASWRRALWTPWSATVVQPWSAGKDYESEPPAGDLSLPFPMVWFDRRDPQGDERIVLSMMSAGGDWSTVANVPASIERASGESLEIHDIVRLPGERWVLIAGCADSGELVLRVIAGARNEGSILSLPITRSSQP